MSDEHPSDTIARLMLHLQNTNRMLDEARREIDRLRADKEMLLEALRATLGYVESDARNKKYPMAIELAAMAGAAITRATEEQK